MTITTVTPAPADVTSDHDPLDDMLAELAKAHEFLSTVRPPVTRFYPCAIGRACTSEAEVDEIAARIGTEARWIAPDQYMTSLEFGANVYYRATYIVKDAAPAQGLGCAA